MFFSGLGPTVSELDVSDLPVFAKMKFSMWQPDVQKHVTENMPGICITSIVPVQASFSSHIMSFF